MLQLPALKGILALEPDTRAALRALILDLRRDARSRAETNWNRRKAFIAAYWATVAVYAGHLARAMR